MTPIYNAKTLREVSTNARLAEYNRIKNDYIPDALLKVNKNNFEAADNGHNSSFCQFNLLCMGLDTDDAQDFFKIGLQSTLKELGFKTTVEISNTKILNITCTW